MVYKTQPVEQVVRRAGDGGIRGWGRGWVGENRGPVKRVSGSQTNESSTSRVYCEKINTFCGNSYLSETGCFRYVVDPAAKKNKTSGTY